MKGHIVLCGPSDPRQIFVDRRLGLLPAGLGGVPVNRLARALADRGWKVTVVSVSQAVDRPHEATSGPLTSILLPMRQRPREYSSDGYRVEVGLMREAIRDSMPDIVHAHWTYEFALAALRSQMPTLVTAHDSPWGVFRLMPDAYRAARILLAVRTRLRSPKMTAVSPFLARAWRHQWGVMGEIPITPNIVDLTPQRSTLLSMEPVVVSIGQDTRLKNMDSLLVAWGRVIRSGVEARLRLVGPGLGAADPLALRHRDVANVDFVGPLSHAATLHAISESSLMVHPSLHESMGLSLAEAMAAGVPVIAGLQSGAVPWTVGDAGVLIDVRDPTAIAHEIKRVLRSPALSERLGERGRSRVRDSFSSDAVVRSVEACYSRI